MAWDTLPFAKQNPGAEFALVDYDFEPSPDNLLGLTFAADEGAFLAGYLAAGMTQTGAVGTFGGIETPTVTIFMVGYQNGVDYYNQQHGTDVEVLGMKLFIGNFESTYDGHRSAEDLIAEGADVIMPVAGPAGLGAAAAAQRHSGIMVIGTNTDWCIWAEETCDVILTSVLKRAEVAVFTAIERALNGTFTGSTYVGSLSNLGVGFAPFHEFQDDVPSDLQDEVDAVREGIIDGSIDTGW